MAVSSLARIRQLERFSDRIVGIEAQKQRSIDLYAAHGLSNETYIIENRNLDRELERLRKRKAQNALQVQEAAASDMVEHSIREYWKLAKASFEPALWHVHRCASVQKASVHPALP